MTLLRTYRATKLETMSLHDENEVYRNSVRLAARYWQANFLKIHFTKRGAKQYGYAPRSGEPGSGRAFKGSYTDRKLRKYGHTLPLVLTGNTRRQALASRDVKATAKGRRATAHAIIRAKKLNFRISEIDQFTTRELADMGRVATRKTKATLSRYAKQSRTTIKV